MNNKGQMAVTEGLIIVFLIALCCGLGYMLIKKPSENSIYEKGSNPVVTDIQPNIHPLCGLIFSINPKDKK